MGGWRFALDVLRHQGDGRPGEEEPLDEEHPEGPPPEAKRREQAAHERAQKAGHAPDPGHEPDPPGPEPFRKNLSDRDVTEADDPACPHALHDPTGDEEIEAP